MSSDRPMGAHSELSSNGLDKDSSRPTGPSSNNRSTSGTMKICKKCGEPLTGQFVRALGGTFHLDCFMCQDCGQIVASKFFPIDDEIGGGQFPLCETDYFRRLDLLCFDCGGALRGSYITALERKYHIEHFTCSVCPTVFGAQDSYYEHEGKVYCHYHYSTQFAQRCSGCQTAILKQFVEIFRNGVNQHWHPECYMIHKFWNVRLAASDKPPNSRTAIDRNATDEERTRIRVEEERMEEKVYRIWSILSTFEESSASCISDMLLHVSNGAYMDGVIVAKKFIWHVEYLFTALDNLDSLMIAQGTKGLSYARESKLLCKKIVAFFTLLSKTQDTGVRKLGVTQELLSLVTGLAHYLKLLIRISLQGALKLERERKNVDGLHRFLDELSDIESIKENDKSLDATVGVSGLADNESDLCAICKKPIEDECIALGDSRFHTTCLACSNCGRDLSKSRSEARWSAHEKRMYCHTCARGVHDARGGFESISRLKQYVFLLRVSLARLLFRLRAGGSLPHTSDDPNLLNYNANEGLKLPGSAQAEPPLLNPASRSKSYGGPGEEQIESIADTIGDVKRLRSTRMDKHLSNTVRKARTSRIIDGPESRSARPGSAGADGTDGKPQDFHIIEDKDVNGHSGPADLTFGHQNSLTLDDIPRIISAEKAKEQRPNAFRHAKHQMFEPSSTQPKLSNGHNRAVSGGQDLDITSGGDMSLQRTKRYFSELTALEYFIVRHVAVMSMAPLVEGHLNLEELLGLIEPRKATWWGKVGNVFKNDGRKVGKKKGVFGVSLDTLIERDGAESTDGVGPGALRIPALLDDAVTAMRKMDMSVVGVFRKNGNIRRLKELADTIDMKGADAVDLSKENPVQVAALLKKFLRELPDPLMTFKLHRLFIASQHISDDNKRNRVLHLTCCLLPKSHRDSLEILFSFLNWCSSFSHVDEESGSKMDVHNLATVITPNILYPSGKNLGTKDSFLAIEAVNTLIECNEAMCQVPDDLQSVLSDSTLFNGSAEITTKEILKRYGDVSKIPVPAQSNATTESLSVSKEGRGTASAFTRVETDPYQEQAWQKERSVRHVQGPNGSSAIPPGSQSNFDLETPPNILFRERTSSTGSQDSRGQAGASGQHRNSGWGSSKPQPGPSGSQVGLNGS